MKKINFHWDYYILAVAVLTVVGFIIRIYNLDYLTLWVDEFVHVNRAKFWPAQPLFTDDNNGILLTMFIIPLFKLFGATAFWARFPSVVFGVLSIPLLYAFGKRYFNKNVGLYAAVFLTFSEYFVFWSRIARNYAIFMFFFLALAYFLGKCLDVKSEYKRSGNKIWDYFRLRPKDALCLVVCFILAFLSHQLVFLVIYAIGFYHLVVFARKLILKEASYCNINAVISYLFVVFCVIAFVPDVQAFMKSLLMVFLPERVAVWVLPDLARLAELFATNPFKSFDIYFNILREDYNLIYISGFVGLVWSWFKYGKAGIYVSSLLVIIFLLMSFIYREPALPRYLIFIYPFFLIGMATVCSEFVDFCTGKIKTATGKKIIIGAFFILIVLLSPVQDSVAMVARATHGRVVPFVFSQWFFPDWRSTLNNVNKIIGPDDVVMATITTYPSFYLNRTTYQFRQKYYNTTTHRYEFLPVDTTKVNAHSLKALERLYREHKTGWLFADYYIQGALTDPAARDFIIRNTDFMYAESNAYVKVFYWNHDVPRRYANYMAELLTPAFNASQQYSVNITKTDSHGMRLRMEAEGIHFDNELILVLNQRQIGVLKKQGENASSNRQSYVLDLNANLFKEGENTIQFVYNTNIKGLKGGKIAVYNMSFRPYP
jgi:4-amino-4-deoxy-L-arabinose transferase-like glycosyltransferase